MLYSRLQNFKKGTFMFKTKWRVVSDKYAGYEIQKKVWFWPFWMQTDRYGNAGGVNSFIRLADAMSCIEKIKKRKDIGKVVWTDEE